MTVSETRMGQARYTEVMTLLLNPKLALPAERQDELLLLFEEAAMGRVVWPAAPVD